MTFPYMRTLQQFKMPRLMLLAAVHRRALQNEYFNLKNTCHDDNYRYSWWNSDFFLLNRNIKGVFLSKKKGEREEDSNKWVNWFLVINLPEILGTFKPFIQCYFFSRDFQSASSETLSDAEGNLSAARNSASTVSSSALQQSRKAVQESCIFCNCKNWNLKSFLTQIQQRLSRGFS